MQRFVRQCFFAVWLLMRFFGTAHADILQEEKYKPDIHVIRTNGGFVVNVTMLVPVTPMQAWSVVTDYSDMANFLPDVSISEILERNGNLLKVHQIGLTRYAFFSAEVDSTRDVELLPPREVRTHGTGGNLRSSDTIMTLNEEGSETRITYHAHVEPNFWFPPIVGPQVVRQQTEQQFTAMLAEMLRRQ